MKYSLISASLIFLASQTAFASPPKPERCPDTSAIAAVGIHTVKLSSHDQTDKWAGFEFSNKYATNEDWTFAVGEFKATNVKDALDMANQSLSSLVLAQGPIFSELAERWYCVYKNAEGYEGYAITPIIPPDMQSFKFRK